MKTHFNGKAKGAGRVSTSCSMILKEGGSALLNHKQTHLRIVLLITNSLWASLPLPPSLVLSDWENLPVTFREGSTVPELRFKKIK